MSNICFISALTLKNWLVLIWYMQLYNLQTFPKHDFVDVIKE